MDALDDFRHLWDGSEPGWRLQRVHHLVWHAIFRFSDNGPSIQEIAWLRDCFPKLRDRPLQDVWGHLRGAASYVVPERLGHSEAYSLGDCAHRQGLTLELKSEQLGGTLIIAPDGHPLAIENA